MDDHVPLGFGLRRFCSFAQWLLARFDRCRITAYLTRKFRPGMLLNHRRVDLLPQSVPGKLLKRPRKRRFRWNLPWTLPPAQPPQILAVAQERNQRFRRRNVVYRLRHERQDNRQTILPLAPDPLPSIRWDVLLNRHNTRRALLTLFSGVLEFNNLFASYKGEGTGAVRHMFSHHILKPERMPIEANPWGTAKSSGAFIKLFRSRLLRTIAYRDTPTEIVGTSGPSLACSAPFAGNADTSWPTLRGWRPRATLLSCGSSDSTGLPAASIDLVVTDPPFFDNVHYSELADFFFAWQVLDDDQAGFNRRTTRDPSEVQDAEPARFAAKLQAVFRECHRVLKDEGLLVFSYHHSREEGWHSLAEAIFGAGFSVINSHPVKAEMSGATPKSQAKEPIQLDIIIVCRKQGAVLANGQRNG